ncbi:MAG: DUF2603 domain-containing protein [Campylobacteraceae bacterium]|jgi:hypothetical protein|nr:DUF2603 domain-containing protein [Campylobacteraceae bacterium]
MENENKIAIYDEIDKISKKTGIDDESIKTILEVEITDNPDIKSLILKSGSWEAKEPWFVIDEKKKIHALISIDTLTKMVENLKTLGQENFELKLEKTIWKHLPVDFGDVWVVAMDEIKNMAKTSQNAQAVKVDIEKLIANIKKKHPSLFVDLKGLYNIAPHNILHQEN